jgi:mRNA interferase YafQ
MAYKLRTTKQFEKDVKRCFKRGLPLDKLRKVMELLEKDGFLPQSYRPHLLHGNRKGQWECHIQPNWLMTWQQNDTELTLLFLQTGTHSDLF